MYRRIKKEYASIFTMQYTNGFVAILESNHSFSFSLAHSDYLHVQHCMASNLLLAPHGSYPNTRYRNHKLASSVVGHELGYVKHDERPRKTCEGVAKDLLEVPRPFETVLLDEGVQLIRTSRTIRIRQRPGGWTSLPVYPVQNGCEDLLNQGEKARNAE